MDWHSRQFTIHILCVFLFFIWNGRRCQPRRFFFNRFCCCCGSVSVLLFSIFSSKMRHPIQLNKRANGILILTSEATTTTKWCVLHIGKKNRQNCIPFFFLLLTNISNSLWFRTFFHSFDTYLLNKGFAQLKPKRYEYKLYTHPYRVRASTISITSITLFSWVLVKCDEHTMSSHLFAYAIRSTIIIFTLYSECKTPLSSCFPYFCL